MPEKQTCRVEQLRAALDHSFDGVWIYDEKQRVIYVNETAAKYNNTQVDAVLGRTWSELQAQGTFKGSAASVAFQKKRPSTQELLSNTGRRILCTATPIFDTTGKVCQVVTNVRDFTELFELTETLHEKNTLIRKYRQQIENLRQQITLPLVAKNQEMKKLVETAVHIANTDVSVLLLGESGVGKNELARLIHRHSSRRDREMIIANCGAIPATLLEAEFFGHERGAFTGANSARPGLFEMAEGSTLMLDEIGELELSMQVKLLRVLQEKRVRRLGGRKEIAVDVRIVAATNRDLQAMVREGTFRADLFYRLNRVPMLIPPLRERPTDLGQLIALLLNRYNQNYKRHTMLATDTLHALETYSWPGNIRELDNLMERLVLLTHGDTITLDQLPLYIQNEREPKDEGLPAEQSLRLAVEQTERRILAAARRKFGNTRDMASALGCSHVTIARKLRLYGLS